MALDPIEILGGMLGQKSGGSSLGGKILRDILTGGLGKSAPAPSPPASRRESQRDSGRSSAGSSSRDFREDDLERQARELEDILNVANDRRQRPSPAPPAAPRTPPPRQEPRPSSDSWNPPPASNFPVDSGGLSQQDKALVLVRAMINAAKADGQVSREEQEQIFRQIGDASSATIGFLREEFGKPLDLREFCFSVPMGMEQQVYLLSLAAIEVDTRAESSYLDELAQGLRISPQVRAELHRRAGAPPVR